MSNIYGRPTDVSSYFIMYQDSNSTTTQQAYNATFADLVDLKILGTNGFTFNGKVQGFCELLTNNTVPNTFWDGSSFSAIPIANASTNGGITNTTFTDWNTRLSGVMGAYTNGQSGNYSNYVNWITDVYNVANTALTNADAAAGVATCANIGAVAALGAIGNISNIPSPYNNIIDWVSGELGGISTQLSNIIGS